MAKYELITYNGKQARQYPDGSIRDTNGRFITQHPEGHTITQADASTLANRLHEKKRAVIAQAANEAVERGDLRIQHGDLAYVAEIGQAMQRKATNIDDPKMVDAARFLLQETGISEKQAVSSGADGDAMHVLAGLGAEMVRHIMRRAENV